MSNSKNLLFLLLIATTQAIRFPIDMGYYCLTDCCVASSAYRTLGGKTVKDQALAKGCCSMLGKKSQSSGIPGVRCTADGNITVLDWANKNLTGRFPSYVDKKLGSLKRVNISGNVNLSGSFAPKSCSTEVSSTSTRVTIDRSKCTFVSLEDLTPVFLGIAENFIKNVTGKKNVNGKVSKHVMPSSSTVKPPKFGVKVGPYSNSQ